MSQRAANPVSPVLARLESGMDYRLVLIVAPEGSGKTRGLRMWAAWRSSEGQRPPCWAGLTVEDNRLAHFLAHLASAVACLDAQMDRRLQADIPFTEIGLSLGSKAAHSRQDPGDQNWAGGFLTELINHLSEVPAEFAVVLDEYHQIHAPEVHRAVDFLVEYLPPQMHLYLAARCEPPLRLAQLRARRQMIEIGPAGL